MLYVWSHIQNKVDFEFLSQTALVLFLQHLKEFLIDFVEFEGCQENRQNTNNITGVSTAAKTDKAMLSLFFFYVIMLSRT